MIEPHHLLNGLLFYYRKAHQFARSVFLERYFSPALHVAIVEFLYVKICRLHIFEQDFFLPIARFHIRTVVGENLACVCGVSLQSVVAYGSFWVSVGYGVGGFLPVAFAVPEVARLVLRPKGIVFCPYAVVKQHVLLSWVGTTAGQPAQVREQTHVVCCRKLLKLLGRAASAYGSVVLRCLIAIKGVQHHSSPIHVAIFGNLLTHLLCGVISLVGRKAGYVGTQAIGKRGISKRNVVDGFA